MLKRIKRMDSVFLPVEDLDTACHFYQNVLGLSILYRNDFTATFAVGHGTPLTVYRKAALGDHQPSHFYLFVQDLHALHADWSELQVEIEPIRDYGSVKMFHLHDPEGNKIEFCHY